MVINMTTITITDYNKRGVKMKNKTLIIILCVISAIAILCAGVFGTLYFVNKGNSQNTNASNHSLRDNNLNLSENTDDNTTVTSENQNLFKIGGMSVFANGIHIYKEFHLDENRVDFVLENQKKNVQKVIYTLYFLVGTNDVEAFAEEAIHCDPYLCFNGDKLYWSEYDRTSGNAYVFCYDIATEQTKKVFNHEYKSGHDALVLFEDEENIYYTDRSYVKSADDSSADVIYTNLSKYNIKTGTKTIIEDRISFSFQVKSAYDQSFDLVTENGKLIYTQLNADNSKTLKVFDFASEKSFEICEATDFYYHTENQIFFFHLADFYDKIGKNDVLNGFTLYSCDLNGANLKELCTFDSIPVNSFEWPSVFDPTVNGTSDYFYFLGYEFDIKTSSYEKIYDHTKGYTTTSDDKLYLMTLENGLLKTYDLNSGFDNRVLLASENIAGYYNDYTDNSELLIPYVASIFSFVQNDSLYTYRLNFDNEYNITTAYLNNIPFNK